MASPVNVSAKITVGFEDQFSAQACQAFEIVKKCAEDAFQVMDSFPKALAPGGFQDDVELFSQSVEKLESSINRMNESLIKSQEEATRFGESLENPSKFVADFWESLKQGNTFAVTTAIAGLTVGLAGLATLNAPLAGLGAVILGVGLNAAFLASLLNDVEESLKALEAQKLIEPKITEDSIFQLERFSSALEPLRNPPDFQLKVDLLDNATGSGAKIRQQLEEMFKSPITQTIVTERVDAVLNFSKSPGRSSSDPFNSFFDDGLPEFLTSSPDLTGFNKSVGFSPAKPALPSFASGIDRVPRDMPALIHKDEAVLPKTQAEDFRRGGSSGMSIENLNFSFNVANGAKLDREEFRNMAFMMRDELKRLDRRID